ncbi:hypothetical protein VTK73DRAFT_1932 [Phialemonium thermophilum]|uniref:Aminotransferase n=1 Tax=Phialemonium thermophilum TaxID=223376 RepID=A0ABR3X6Z6_9PEZI
MGDYLLHQDIEQEAHADSCGMASAHDVPASLPLPPAPPSVTGGRPLLTRGEGHYLFLEDGQRITDGCGGAAVACIGHGRKDVAKAMAKQIDKFTYVSWAHFDNKATRDLADWLIKSTGGEMGKAYIMCSGSEVVEAALKLAREYFVWIGQTRRVHFITRDDSYHGTTIGSLSLSGHVSRRAPFEPLLMRQRHRISAFHPYRQRLAGESDAEFVGRKAEELEQQFLELGPDSVAAVVMEPVVGAALGCVPAVPGYFKSVQDICRKYGALLIFDEVMCGMGRTGTLHAWEQEGVVPDLQTLGKGLAGGYQPASALLVGKDISRLMESQGRTFTHGHTYQNHPVVAAAALKVQQIVQDEDLLTNVRTQGAYLQLQLREKLGSHPNVGDIRGRGLFWAVEFVRDRSTKEPFPAGMQIALRVQKLAQNPPYNVLLYQGQGCAGGGSGDHVMIMPAYNVDSRVIDEIVAGLSAAVEAFFSRVCQVQDEGDQRQDGLVL